MTPFWVTRQFHCPEVEFFFFFSLSLSLSCLRPKMKVVFKERQCWWNSLKSDWGGERRESSVNTYEQSFRLPVSAQEGTIKRGIEAEPLSSERKTLLWLWLSFSSLKSFLSRVEPPNKPFRFSSVPLIPTCKSAMGFLSASLRLHIRKLCSQTSNSSVLSLVSQKTVSFFF